MKQTWGGAIEFEYHHDKYWKELIKISDERKGRWKERWRGLGSLIGTREWIYKQLDENASETMIVDPDTEVRDDGCDHRLCSPLSWVVIDD